MRKALLIFSLAFMVLMVAYNIFGSYGYRFSSIRVVNLLILSGWTIFLLPFIWISFIPKKRLRKIGYILYAIVSIPLCWYYFRGWLQIAFGSWNIIVGDAGQLSV